MAGRPALMLATLLAAVDVPPVTDADMRTATEELAVEVAALRRIKLHGPLERQLITRDEARAQVERSIMAAVTGSEMSVEERVLVRLGLLPPGTDYARLLAEAYGASPVGSYDPTSKRLYVPDWIPLPRQRVPLAHEIAHALADQRFGLRRLLQIGPDGRHRLDADAERARQALIEGDATTTAFELADPRGTFLGTRGLPAAAARLREAAAGAAAAKWDPWIRTLALFTQVDGFVFVARVRAREPWAAVDALWSAPPASTEQVLHPEKYAAREGPAPIEAVPLAALGPALRPGGATVLGEVGVRAWLATATPPEIADRAAAGWGGDRAVLYLASGPAAGSPADGGAPPEPALAWLTVWDDVVDAEDFARAAALVLAKLAGQPPTVPDEAGRVVLRSPGGGTFALAWRRDAVALLLGAPDGAAPALEEMLTTWRPRPAAKGAGSRRRER